MLRDGVTGDWYVLKRVWDCDRADYLRIGTFFGHKGAVYQARLSPDTQYAATASADFTAYVAYFSAVNFANSS
jgi:serine-threonine kinase receptor-associated protein